MISPKIIISWLVIGLFVQWLYPKTLLNSDNVSVTTLQFGLIGAFITSMAALWLSFLWESKPNESRVLNSLYNLSSQFIGLAMGVAAFSSAHFLCSSIYGLPIFLVISSIALATSSNHLFLVVFNRREIGTYKWVLSLDERKGTTWDTFGIKVVLGLVALCSMVFIGAVTLGYLNGK